MSKLRRTRVVLGVITRADGVRVEVRNPTVWKLINEQAATTQTQQQVLESLKGTIAKLEAERDHANKWVDELDRHWWIRLGVWLSFVRLVVVTPAHVGELVMAARAGTLAPRKSEAIPAA